jgi:hypothetical protein
MGQDAATTQGGNITAAALQGGNFRMQGAEGALGASQYTAGLGLQGASAIGGNTMDGARTAADLLTQQGNARASGVTGSANSWNGALGGVASSVTNAAILSKYLKNPAVPGGGGPSVRDGA